MNLDELQIPKIDIEAFVRELSSLGTLQWPTEEEIVDLLLQVELDSPPVIVYGDTLAALSDLAPRIGLLSNFSRACDAVSHRVKAYGLPSPFSQRVN